VRAPQNLVAGLALVATAIVTKLNGALVKALDDEATRKRLLDLGGVISDRAGRTPEALEKLVASEIPRWNKVLRPQTASK
jgi:tripartite-type tricarboxylate transporter receptor subunit TctC